MMFLTFENVIEILKTMHYSTLIESLESVGMAAHADVFCSVDFGLPQKRERA